MNRIAEFFDAYGEREWTRFEDGRNSRASLETHVRFLERFVRDGDRVLDAGAGPGRFTRELVRLGADVTALDLSPVQLELLHDRLPEVETVVGDIRDLPFAHDSFDAAVCFGGPLSYTHGEGVEELVRVVRPGGLLLVSVMSLVGCVVHYAKELVDLGRRDGADRQLEIVDTGNLPEEPGYGHLAMRLYRWRELEALLAPYGELVAGAAAGLLPTLSPDEPELAQLVVDLEARVCEDPQSLSVGQHMIAVLEVGS
ncbi:MAG TPA: class I SAM-dependent methyltransferase [Gaiellaceae bacterium]|nr:class I SAM-dependent methyltransferase [Gaiellaceae bacterium]